MKTEREEGAVSIDQMIEEVYERLSAFARASEQLAEQARLSEVNADGWKRMTVEFSRSVDDTRQWVESIVTSSRTAVEISQQAQTSASSLYEEISQARLAQRLETIERDQHEMLKHLVEMRTRYLEKLEGVERLIADQNARLAGVERKARVVVLALCVVVVLGVLQIVHLQ